VIRINLAPVEARGGRGAGLALSLPSFNLGIAFAIVYVLAVGGLGFYWFSLQAEETRVAADVDRLNRELTSLKATLGQSANVKGQLAEVRRRVDILEELTKSQAKPIALMDAFADTVPQDLWITSLEQKESLLKLSGTAYSTAAVSDFMANLKGSGKFRDVDIVVSRQDIAKSPSLVTFEVTCKFEI
jgi:type IV pilus assembly protein PilN